MNHPVSASRGSHGFTLVEMAIVLVIIGLIIGGILVGQDMIQGAEIRAGASQFEKYSAAANTFKDKYNNLPGDIGLRNAASFGLPTRPVGSGMPGRYDQNGLLEGCANMFTNTYVGCETTAFYSDLASVQLINQSFVQPNSLSAITTTVPDDVALYLPASEIGESNYIMVYGVEGYNFFQAVGIITITGGAPQSPQARMTPQQAMSLDSKMDDGRPLTGAVLARRGAPVSGYWVPNLPADANICLNSTGSNYNTSTQSLANTASCSVRVRFN